MTSLQEIEYDIKNGDSDAIFYSTKTLWWTHLLSDLKEATLKGRENLCNKIEERLKDKKLTPEIRTQLRLSIVEIKHEHTTPLDPEGNVLFEYRKPELWISDAKKNEPHFGEYGIEAFISTHHRNCKKGCPVRWNDVNNYLSVMKMIKR